MGGITWRPVYHTYLGISGAGIRRGSFRERLLIAPLVLIFFRELLLPQLFVAGLKDSDGRIVSYVGVQCEVNQVSVDTMRERAAKLATLDM